MYMQRIVINVLNICASSWSLAKLTSYVRMDAPQLSENEVYEHTHLAMFLIKGLGLLPDCSDVEVWAYFIITRLYEPIDNLN